MAEEPDERYCRDAKVVFDQNTKMADKSFDAATTYGKWLVTSILALNTTGLGAVLYRASTGGPGYAVTAFWFLAGIVLALLLGLFSWVNFDQNYREFDRRADYRMLRDRNFWPAGSDFSHIGFTYGCAIAFGVLSVAAFAAGGLHVWIVASK
jgi:hypothetical protein